MKFDIAQAWGCKSEINLKGLNRAVQILVVDSILIMPKTDGGIRHLVADEYNPIVSRIGFDLGHRRVRPGHDGGLHAHCVTDRRKRERRVDAGHAILTVRGVVVLIALPRMSLAPGIFMRCDVLRLGEVGRAWIERRVQVIDLNQNSV